MPGDEPAKFLPPLQKRFKKTPNNPMQLRYHNLKLRDSLTIRDVTDNIL